MDRQQLIAARIRQARKLLSWNQQQLGTQFGVSASAISDIENAKTDVSFPDLERLAHILGKPVEWFVSDQIDSSQLGTRRPLRLQFKELEERYEALEVIEIPLRGALPSKTPLQDSGDVILIPKEELEGNIDNIYALKVSGHSLTNTGIADDDIVIVSPDSPLTEGRIYVIQIEDQIVAGHLYKENDTYRIIVSNGIRKVIDVAKARILGRIVLAGKWRKY